MPGSKQTKLTGQILSIEIGDGFDDDSNEIFWVDLTLKLIKGHIVNIQYAFPRESARDNIRNSLQKGLTITVSVAGQADIDGQLDYKGIGAIQIHDLPNELDRYLREKFRITEEDYFTEREVAFLSQLLTNAKDRIKETFEPSEEDMAKIEEHLESLARNTASVTKYDWRRLFISCVLSVSIDLGFGATAPEVLYNLFKKLVEEFIEYRLPAPQ